MESSNKRVEAYKGLLTRKPIDVKLEPSFFENNRTRLLNRFKKAHPEKVKGGVILLGSQHSSRLHDTEVKVRTGQSPAFYWTFGTEEEEVYGGINIENGRTVIFYTVAGDGLEEKAKQERLLQIFKPDLLCPVDEFASFLTEEYGAKTVYLYHGVDSDSGNTPELPQLPDLGFFEVDKETLFPILVECRVFKSDEEANVLRTAARISSEAHIAVMQNIKPGLMEYQIEALFKFHCHLLGGKDVAYACICASGRDAATLHYQDNDKVQKDGTLVLADMGCKFQGYCADITCTYPVNGKFTKKQKEIYDAVLDATLTVEKTMKPGIKWEDMHLLAEKIIVEHLIKLGLVKDAPWEELKENRIGAIFFPHGLGHLLGLAVHDCGGYMKGLPERIMQPGLKSLRTRRTLDKGMCITVEPGLYFIETLLEQAYKDETKSKYLVKEKIDEYMEVGGVRIEDDVIVTDDGIENFTVVPRTTEEIEKCMAGLDWRS